VVNMGEFPEDVVRRAWTRAGGRCECRRKLMSIHMDDVTRNLYGKIGDGKQEEEHGKLIT